MAKIPLRKVDNHHGLAAKVRHKLARHEKLISILNGGDGSVEWVDDFFAPGEEYDLDVLDPECAGLEWTARASFLAFKVDVLEVTRDTVVMANRKSSAAAVGVGKNLLARACLDNYGVTYGASICSRRRVNGETKLKNIGERETPDSLVYHNVLPADGERNILYHPSVAEVLLVGGLKNRVCFESRRARIRRGIEETGNTLRSWCINPGAADEIFKGSDRSWLLGEEAF